MKLKSTFSTLLVLFAVMLSHGVGLKNYVLCMENDGRMSVELSKDGDCCIHSNEHSSSDKVQSKLESGHEDIVFVQGDILQKSNETHFILGQLSQIVLLHLFNLQTSNEVNVVRTPSSHVIENSIQHHASVVFLI